MIIGHRDDTNTSSRGRNEIRRLGLTCLRGRDKRNTPCAIRRVHDGQVTITRRLVGSKCTVVLAPREYEDR